MTHRGSSPAVSCTAIAEDVAPLFPCLCFNQDWVSATEVLVEMGEAGLTPSARSTRQWRLASAAIEEIDLDVDEGPGDDYFEDPSNSPWKDQAPR